MSDHINSRIVFNSVWDIRNCWMAFRLEDGWSDGNLYDSKEDAIKHVSSYQYYAFFCFRNCMAGSTPRDCQIWLDLHRHAYEHGGLLTDPDIPGGGPQIIVSTKGYDHLTFRPARPERKRESHFG
jgi:hypothetical protein